MGIFSGALIGSSSEGGRGDVVVKGMSGKAVAWTAAGGVALWALRIRQKQK